MVFFFLLAVIQAEKKKKTGHGEAVETHKNRKRNTADVTLSRLF